MFCEKCGNQISDGSKFCPKCGAEVRNSIGIQSQKRMSEKEKTVSKKGNINPVIIKGIIIAAAVIIVLGLIRVIAGGNSAEKVALKSCKAELDGNIKAYYSLLAPSYLEYMVGSGGWYSTDEEFQEVIKEDATSDYNMMQARCGTGVKLTYEVEDVVKCEDESQLNRIKNELSSYYDYDSDKIKDAAVVTVSVQGYGSEGADYWTKQISCVKIGRKWYIHRPGFELY